MSEPKPGLKKIAVTCLLIAVILLVAYLLSTGPVIWLGSRGYVSIEFFFAYTTPLGWIASTGGIAKSVVVWWLRFWVNDPRD